MWKHLRAIKVQRCFCRYAEFITCPTLPDIRFLLRNIPSKYTGEIDKIEFSIDFSPFDNESQYELGRTNEVAFPVEYGQTYRIHLVQDETGYHAIPEWMDAE